MASHMLIDFISMDLSTLLGNTAKSAPTKIDAARLQGVRIKKFEYIIRFSGKPAPSGPIVIGFCRAGLSDNEIGTFHQADPQSRQDTPAIDEARLDVYPVLVALNNQSAAPEAQPSMPSHYRTLNWPWKHLPEGDGLLVYAYNDGAQLTGNTIVSFHLKIIEEFVNV